MRYAMVLLNKVIDIVTSDTVPFYPPDPQGNVITAVECGEEVQIGWVYENGEFHEYVPPEPQEEDVILSDEETAMLEMQAGIEYLVAIAEMQEM